MLELERKESESKNRAVALFDIDDTLTQGNTTVSFGTFLYENEVLLETAWLQMLQDIEEYKKSDHGKEAYERFAKNVLSDFAYGLMGKKTDLIVNEAHRFFQIALQGQWNGYRVHNFAGPLVGILKEHKILTIAISGSPFEILVPIKDYLGFDVLHTTDFGKDDDIFTGEVVLNLAVDREKERVIRDLKSMINFGASYAFGDTEHDLPLLECVGNPFVLGNNANLQRIGDERGWNVVPNGKGVLEMVRNSLELLP